MQTNPVARWPATGHPPESLEQISHPHGALLGCGKGQGARALERWWLRDAVRCGCTAQAQTPLATTAPKQMREPPAWRRHLCTDIGIDAVGQGNAGHRSAWLGALSEDLLFEPGVVSPAGLLLGFIHGVHLNRLVDTIVAA